MSAAPSRPLAKLLTGVLDEIPAEPGPEHPAGMTPAAVLVVLRDPPAGAGSSSTAAAGAAAGADIRVAPETEARSALGDLRVLLTRRRADLRRHAGEIAFPGGRCDAADASLQETALREAEEEIGLARERVLPLGALGVAQTLSTNYAVYPVVALLASPGQDTGPGAVAGVAAVEPESREAWRISDQEVDAVLDVSLGELEASRGRERLTRRGFTFETDVFTIEEGLIWGLTQRILDDLLRRVQLAG